MMYGQNTREIRLSQILINESFVSGYADKAAGDLDALRRLEEEGETEQARRLLKETVERCSNGANTVLFDAKGLPSVMVIVPAIRGSEMPEGIHRKGVHPAFRVGKRTIRRVYVSKYINCLADGTAVSLPMSEPARVPCFDEAVKRLRGKGAGWMLMPVSLRAAILLRGLARGRLISGNTDHGQDYYQRRETGVLTESGTVLTGSGPAGWTHNGRRDGIWDLVGNLNEWDSGLRLMDGEIQLMDTEAMMNPECDYGKNSPLWHALDERGEAAAPGAPGTLRFDGEDGKILVTKEARSERVGNCAFRDVEMAPGLRAPEPLKLLGLLPPLSGLSERLGWRWISTAGEALPLSGGAFRITFHSGPFFMGLTKPRDADYPLSGVRTVYCSPEDMREVEHAKEDDG